MVVKKDIEILAYEMEYKGGFIESTLELDNIESKDIKEYIKIYNLAFYEMRKALGVEPYNFYSSEEVVENKKEDIYILKNKECLIGAVSIGGNEIDDLIVYNKYQGLGYGKKLLNYAINKMQKNNINPIKLHVAKWNEKALSLYESIGFQCVNIEKIR